MHQITDGKNYKKPKLNNVTLTYIQDFGQGLSRSRNICLSKSKSDYVIFSDDDVLYYEDSITRFKNLVLNNPDVDIITFKASCIEDGSDFRSYPNDRMSIQDVRSFRPCSIEIAVKRTSVTNGNVLPFDERFGLGSRYPMHEESIFINNALMNNSRVKFFPIVLVQHKKESTGTHRLTNPRLVSATGAYYRIVYGRPLSLVLCIRNTMKALVSKQRRISIFNYFYSLVRGEALK